MGDFWKRVGLLGATVAAMASGVVDAAPTARFDSLSYQAPVAEGDRAGLHAFMDEGHFLSLSIERLDGTRTVTIRRRAESGDGEHGELVASVPLSNDDPVGLRLALDGGIATGFVRKHGGRWMPVGEPIDVEPLASIHAGLFTGLVVGPFAVAAD